MNSEYTQLYHGSVKCDDPDKKPLNIRCTTMDDAPSFLRQQIREDYSRFLEYFKALLITGKVLILLGILSNLVVCVVMIRGRKRFKSSVANFLILHLAIADLIFRFGGVAAAIADRLKKSILSPPHCKVIIFTQGACAAVMFFLLTEIAIDRFVHIVYPLRSLRMKWPKVRTIVLTWLAGIIVSSPLLFTATNKRLLRAYSFSNESYAQNRSNIADQLRRRSKSQMVFDLQTDDCVTGNAKFWTTKMATTGYILFAFLIPLVVITVSYGKILIFLCKRKRMGTMNSALARSRFKTTRTLVLVVLSVIISWGPLSLMETIQSFYNTELYIGEFPLRPLLVCFSYTSSILNCVIYAFGNSNFRREMKCLFSRSKVASQRSR